MSYNIDLFQGLREKYPTYSELEEYLTSSEGGNLRCIVHDHRYAIFRYVEEKSDFTKTHVKWFRSVVWDMEKNRPVCVAPPKAESSPIPTGESSKFTMIQDFLDGTMINVFRTIDDPNALHLTTRSSINASGTFYSRKPFNALFWEALAAHGITYDNLLKMLPSPQVYNDSACFASFLLQHPENRIVTPIEAPRLFIVNLGFIDNQGNVKIVDDIMRWTGDSSSILDDSIQHSDLLKPFYIPRHNVGGFCTQNDLEYYFNDLVNKNGQYWKGLVFKDDKGNRWRMHNEKYLELRTLRGNEPQALGRFLRIYMENKLEEYLDHFTEDEEPFFEISQCID